MIKEDGKQRLLLKKDRITKLLNSKNGEIRGVKLTVRTRQCSGIAI